MTAALRFCRSRNDARRCTRPLGHPGLHRHRTIMWTDAGADAAHCEGAGAPGTPAPMLPDGFPAGRALCETCLEFVAIDGDGRLAAHHTAGADDGSADRAAWFNTYGWSGGAPGN